MGACAVEFESYTRACRDCLFFERGEGDTGWCRLYKKRTSGADRHFPDKFAWHPPPGVSTLEWRRRRDLITNAHIFRWPPNRHWKDPLTNELEFVDGDLFQHDHAACLPYFCFMPAVEDDPQALKEASTLADAIKSKHSYHQRAVMGTVLYMLGHYPELVERAKGTDREAEELARSLQQLDKVIRQLPEDLQATVAARYKDGLTQAQTAKRLKVNQSTVSRREQSAVEMIAQRSEEPYLLVSCDGTDAATYVGLSPDEYKRIERAGQSMVGTILGGEEEFVRRYGSVAAVANEEVRRLIGDSDDEADLRGELAKAVILEWQNILTADNPPAYCISVIRQKMTMLRGAAYDEKRARQRERPLEEADAAVDDAYPDA